MKKITKILIIIGMALSWFLIYPVVLGICAIKKLESARFKNDLVSWAIITLVFVSPVAGILMLTLRDEDLGDEDDLYYAENTKPTNFALEKLNNIEKIYQLKEKGLISEEEFLEKKKFYLEQI